MAISPVERITNLLTLLLEVTGLFDMQTRPELILLQKTMVVVEGVARTLNPDLNMWVTAEPVVRGDGGSGVVTLGEPLRGFVFTAWVGAYSNAGKGSLVALSLALEPLSL